MAEHSSIEISGILETCLYVDDLNAAEQFYSLLPGLEMVSKEKGRHIFFRCKDHMLLLFNPDHTANEQTTMNGDLIPLHGSKGAGHLAFSVDNKKIDDWREFLLNKNIEIESEVTWPTGSVSLYFRDPAGNSLEVVSPSIWK